MILFSFFSALFLAISVELLVLFILGFRKKKEYLILALINCITNPLINLLVLLNYYFLIFRDILLFILFLEIIVIFVEAKLLTESLGKLEKTLSYFSLSLIINFVSFIVGVLVFGLPQ